MKAVILAGGLGTRLSEETVIKPKPMVEIGGRPILWHIMKIYSAYGIDDFIICLGYKGYIIKEYFANYFLHNSDVTFDLKNNQMKVHANKAEAWTVTLVDTGDESMTGGRLKRVKKFLDDETFCFTYGDGVADVNIKDQLEFHKKHGKKATMTVVQPPGRFGAVLLDQTRVASFSEKPKGDNTWINGGFFILEPSVIDLIKNDDSIWERYPLERLAEQDQLQAYCHDGFWRPMDTLRDKTYLENLWAENKAPWKVW
ncbi:MAG: glucose-1-phosphate cytidylyltransferase [Candidatus Rifleibacteriota bacterium]